MTPDLGGVALSFTCDALGNLDKVAVVVQCADWDQKSFHPNVKSSQLLAPLQK
jgi:hypothetical protein